jgi:hypothetical protein
VTAYVRLGTLVLARIWHDACDGLLVTEGPAFLIAEVSMDEAEIRQTLDDIKELLGRIADATERLASCVGREYGGVEDRLMVSDAIH